MALSAWRTWAWAFGPRDGLLDYLMPPEPTCAPCKDRIGLLTVLLAEGLNLGMSKMAEATDTHSYFQLSSLSNWYVEGEAITRALAMVIEAQSALPMARFWGAGITASSDGQFFPVARQGEAMNLINAKYGTEPGHLAAVMIWLR
jgi:hypothetical protein